MEKKGGGIFQAVGDVHVCAWVSGGGWIAKEKWKKRHLQAHYGSNIFFFKFYFSVVYILFFCFIYSFFATETTWYIAFLCPPDIAWYGAFDSVFFFLFLSRQISPDNMPLSLRKKKNYQTLTFFLFYIYIVFCLFSLFYKRPHLVSYNSSDLH